MLCPVVLHNVHPHIVSATAETGTSPDSVPRKCRSTPVETGANVSIKIRIGKFALKMARGGGFAISVVPAEWQNPPRNPGYVKPAMEMLLWPVFLYEACAVPSFPVDRAMSGSENPRSEALQGIFPEIRDAR